jgi:ribosomal protein L21E
MRAVKGRSEVRAVGWGTKPADFAIGARVKVRVHFCDGYQWHGETGKVVNNTGEPSGIQVEFDEPRMFGDGFTQHHFWFDPEDLKIL